MKNFWAIHCKNHVAGMENCMDEEEDHHPGRLAGPTELIPKIVHDIIHQDERDAVRGIFKQDGITGFNPGRWTGKHIPEDTSISHKYGFNSLDCVKFFKKLQGDIEEREEQRKKEELQETMKTLSEWNKMNNFISSLPKKNLAVNIPSYSEVYNKPTLLPSLKPAFCLGGNMDKEAMERKSIPYGYSHPMIKNAPNGYGGGPVFFTPSGGWQLSR
ncbi:MAG: hypothetical protein AAB493_00640 [Patescibacteria group bacterium]